MTEEYTYGISQNPDTKDYIIVLQDEYCEKCSEEYTDIKKKWCKPCQIDYLKKNFTNWTSKNEKVDNFIQEMQLKINYYNNIIFEWIPYNQFDNIKEIGITLHQQYGKMVHYIIVFIKRNMKGSQETKKLV